MKGKIEEMIKQLEKAGDEKIEQNKKEFESILARFNKMLLLINKYKGRKQFTEDELKEIQSINCFSNIGFCCGLSKPCHVRDTVMYILGISKKEFQEKENWVKNVLRKKNALG